MYDTLYNVIIIKSGIHTALYTIHSVTQALMSCTLNTHVHSNFSALQTFCRTKNNYDTPSKVLKMKLLMGRQTTKIGNLGRTTVS